MSESTVARAGPVQPYIAGLPLYVPGRSPASAMQEQSATRVIQLASNENPHGHSAAVNEAVLSLFEATGELSRYPLSRYPDSEAASLREALAAFHGVSSAAIAVTNGSHELVDLCAALSLDRASQGIYSQYAFQAYPISIGARGAAAIEVPAVGFGHDLAGFASRIGPQTRLIYLCNPNNPTGTLLAPSALADFLAAVAPDILVVLDEAYIEFADESARPDSVALVSRHPNLVVARTFSKAYGLAAARIGYGIMSPELAAGIARIRPTFSVSKVAQVAALAALADQDFIARTVGENRHGRRQLTDAFSRHGLEWVPSHANFVMVRVPRADRVVNALLDEGIIVRPLHAYGLDEHIRVTVGTAYENGRFLDALLTAMDRV